MEKLNVNFLLMYLLKGDGQLSEGLLGRCVSVVGCRGAPTNRVPAPPTRCHAYLQVLLGRLGAGPAGEGDEAHRGGGLAVLAGHLQQRALVPLQVSGQVSPGNVRPPVFTK